MNKLPETIYRYLVVDGRWFLFTDTEPYFASNDLDEAVLAASEMGVGFLVLEASDFDGSYSFVFDGSTPRDLGLKN